MRSDNVKGYLFALIGTLAFANEYIFSKAALNEIQIAPFGFYWFLVSLILALIYVFWNKSIFQISTFTKKQIRPLLILGFLEILTASSFYLSVKIIPDPAVTSFLGNMYPVMLAAGGVIILKERFSLIDSIGALLALTGAFIVGYTGKAEAGSMFIPGTGIVLFNALLATTASLVVKVHVKKIDPGVLILNRSIWLFIFSLIMVRIFNNSLIIPFTALKNIIIGASLGPFLAILTIYLSFRYMDASRSSVIQSIKGVFVLIGAYLFFGTFPQPHQIFGGVVSVIGILIMSLMQAGMINNLTKILKRKNRDNY